MNRRLELVSRTPRLLIACDFDGTLAPIVPEPDKARPLDGVLDTLDGVSKLRQTTVAIISGRALADLKTRVGLHPRWWYVGSHGAELSGATRERSAEQGRLLIAAITPSIERVAPASKGFLLERKPASVAIHYRFATADDAHAAIIALVEEVAGPAGLAVKHGKMVVELCAFDWNKGQALRELVHLVGATAVLYVGDDSTDEDAFRALGAEDLTLKVGSPPTHADVCIPSAEAACELLADLGELRHAWSLSEKSWPIEQHAVLSDQRTIAVLTPDARVCWLCVPRVDSGAVFAELLGGPAAGFFSVGPADRSAPVGQRNLGDNFVLETTWQGLRVVDYLDCSGGRAFQRAGRTDLLRCIEGQVPVRIEFAPRADFGRSRTTLVPVEGGLLVEGLPEPLALLAPGVEWRIVDAGQHQSAVAELPASALPLTLELRHGTRGVAPARISEPERRSQTDRHWSAWCQSLQLPTVATALCRRSALALRALCHGPSGAILAAATTSLPETAGGVRNWDYRYCWPRDAALAAAALVRVGNTGSAMRFLDWLLGVVDHCAGPEKLRPIYTVSANELGSEAEISDLIGYRGSRPTRIGNAAAHQVQIDVFGPIVDLVALLAESGAAVSPDHWRLVEAMAAAVERSWEEPDHGIWEVRTERRHHVHTKNMCWLALDRAARLAESFVGVRRVAWESLRDRIRDDVLARGFDPTLNAFVCAYDMPQLDAATLLLGLTGLVAPTDPRFVSTVEAISRGLLDRGTVYRYRYDDALPGPEGGFHVCTGWLIEALMAIGRRADAERLFERLIASAGPTGLMAEQWCPDEQTSLGNYPQAYSHAAVINAARALERAASV